MKVILNHKSRAKMSEDVINNLSMVKSYLEVKKLQEYIEMEDIILQLKQSIVLSQELYKDLVFIYRKKDVK